MWHIWHAKWSWSWGLTLFLPTVVASLCFSVFTTSVQFYATWLMKFFSLLSNSFLNLFLMRMITCNFFTENFLALSTLYLPIKTELGCQLQMFVKRSVGARRHAALGVGCYTHKNENGDKVSIFPNVRSICSQVTFNSISLPVWIIIKMAYHGALPYLMKKLYSPIFLCEAAMGAS